MHPSQDPRRPQPTPTVRLPGDYAAGYQGGQTTHDERQWALTAYIGQFMLWMLPALYIYLTKRNRSAFAKHHARQALNLALTSFIVFFVSVVLSQWNDVFLWVAAGWVTLALSLVVWSATKVNTGSWHKLPKIVAWPLIK